MAAITNPLAHLKPKRTGSIVRRLRDELGGHWTYRGQGVWTCADGRTVRRVHTGGYDITGEPLPGSSLFLYEPGMSGRHLTDD
jgi:hypothetical protein